MIDKISLTWAQFKAVAVSKARIRSSIRGSDSLYYYMTYTDSAGVFECSVLQDGGADQTEYEASYAAAVNKNADPLDTDGSPIIRDKITQAGWTFAQRGIILKTSKIGSLECKKNDNTDWSDVSLKFYNASNTELTTQGDCDTDCVKTVMDWEPTFNYDLIGGELITLTTPTDYDNECRFWVVVAPDIAQAYGGSINLIDNRVVRSASSIKADGRRVKTMYYSSTYHTNKFRIILRHQAGQQVGLIMIYEYYYAR